MSFSNRFPECSIVWCIEAQTRPQSVRRAVFFFLYRSSFSHRHHNPLLIGQSVTSQKKPETEIAMEKVLGISINEYVYVFLIYIYICICTHLLLPNTHLLTSNTHRTHQNTHLAIFPVFPSLTADYIKKREKYPPYPPCFSCFPYWLRSQANKNP